VVWCVYPSEEKETPVFEETSHWLCFHQVDRDLLLKHMMDATSEKSIVVGKSPFPRRWVGLTIVIACGDPDFSADVREAVIDRRATRSIDFVEVQYRPSTRSSRATNDVDSEKGKDKRRTADDADLEKGRGKPRRIRGEEEEEWDDITLYSPTGTVADDTPQKTLQKKTN
jgi:hypothetical protein